MKLFDKVAIIGVGLIGGSIALAMRKKRLAKEVIGMSRHRKTLLLAQKMGAIDKGSQDIGAVKNADLVILATPIDTILNLAPVISKIIMPNCITSDVGSTKQEIVSKCEKFFSHYVGSHPLAGSEKRGITNASLHIFQGSLCILTPTKNTHTEDLKKIEKLWKALGARVTFLTPATHDKILSLTSHLPHVVAFSLIAGIPARYLNFAYTSLKDTTRIAASDSELWSGIFLSNPGNTIRSIEIFEKNLSAIKSAIQKKDRRQLMRILNAAKEKRDIL